MLKILVNPCSSNFYVPIGKQVEKAFHPRRIWSSKSHSHSSSEVWENPVTTPCPGLGRASLGSPLCSSVHCDAPILAPWSRNFFLFYALFGYIWKEWWRIFRCNGSIHLGLFLHLCHTDKMFQVGVCASVWVPEWMVLGSWWVPVQP